MSYRSSRFCRLSILLSTALLTTAATAGDEDLPSLLEAHTANKQRVLSHFEKAPPVLLARHFHVEVRDIWRQIQVDDSCNGKDKQAFLRTALAVHQDNRSTLYKSLAALLESHRKLFGAGEHADLMVRHAADPAFRPFGRHLTAAEAAAEMMAGTDAEVQAFQTIWEMGRNTRGYIHKLECHAEAVEYIYAVSDIVYGVMLPSDLDFGQDKVTADPMKVRMFYVRAGEVIALHPYVLHSGSLSVEPDHNFSILIYKKPAATKRQVVALPDAWRQHQDWLKIVGADKFYLTLAELHTDDLKDNRGFIPATRPLRLPAWK
jgi:hypothetical protein